MSGVRDWGRGLDPWRGSPCVEPGVAVTGRADTEGQVGCKCGGELRGYNFFGLQMGKLRPKNGNLLSKVPEWVGGRARTRSRTRDYPRQPLLTGSPGQEVQEIAASGQWGD